MVDAVEATPSSRRPFARAFSLAHSEVVLAAKMASPESGDVLAIWDTTKPVLPDAGSPDEADAASEADRPDAWEAGMRSWGAAAWAWVEPRARAVGASAGPHAVWPRVGGVVSDAASLRRFLREFGDAAENPGSGWRFILDPVAMLTRSMCDDAEIHVRRTLDTFGGHAACAGVVLADIAESAGHRRRPGGAGVGNGGGAVGATGELDRVEPVPIGAGVLSGGGGGGGHGGGLLAWYRDACPPDLPVILHDAALASQVALVTSA